MRTNIVAALAAFENTSFHSAARSLFAALGYKSDRVLQYESIDAFLAEHDSKLVLTQLIQGTLGPAARPAPPLLMQLTNDEIAANSTGQLSLLPSRPADLRQFDSYLVLCLSLGRSTATRAQLAACARAVNSLFSQPVLVLFHYDGKVTLAVTFRRRSLRNELTDVIDRKVTLISDINCHDPHAGHLAILDDFSLNAIAKQFQGTISTFADLDTAWRQTLSSQLLNRRFYRELATWYFWASTIEGIRYPAAIEGTPAKSTHGRELRSVFLIRLLTRLIFCWFLREKGLIPPSLFRRHEIEQMLGGLGDDGADYYPAILQNLFFATLNVPRERREFRGKASSKRAKVGADTSVYRFENRFSDLKKFARLVVDIPYLNGGLFDCLDGSNGASDNEILDGYVERSASAPILPNVLFFGESREIDVAEFFSDGDENGRKMMQPVRGIITILQSYKFTLEESTPIEEEIALDPELLGNVFENLLASYNEDTRTSARRATGSFYTPREIVSYMTEKSLRRYFEAVLAQHPVYHGEKTSDVIQWLFGEHAEETHAPPPDDLVRYLVRAIDVVKVLDPACGSGAFPMGILQGLVRLLRRLDPENVHWRQLQLLRAEADCELALASADVAHAPGIRAEHADRIEQINRAFDDKRHTSDYARKLYLIENCIFGVDIQPIATQITKLRLFIGLIVDQRRDVTEENLGIRPLPNLETKIVAANFLVPMASSVRQLDIFEDAGDLVMKENELRRQLADVRHRHFYARTQVRKHECQEDDARLRKELSRVVAETRMQAERARQIAQWNPYDQNAHADFFDANWMFNFDRERERERVALQHDELAASNPGATAPRLGFDVIIGNPPYIRLQTLKRQDPSLVALLRKEYGAASGGNYDLYVVFVEAGLRLLAAGGYLAYIMPHRFMNAQYGRGLRAIIAGGQYLDEIVHFGDQQVFPGATNYVCLTFLDRGGREVGQFVKADDLGEWLRSQRGMAVPIVNRDLSDDDWNFVVGSGANVFDRLRKYRTKLQNLAAGIVQGIRTSANDVYVLDLLGEKGETLHCFSKELQREVEIERDAVKYFLQGREIKAYAVKPSGKVVIVPYRLKDGRSRLVELDEIKDTWPHTYDYLKANREVLQNREHGRMHVPQWHAYVYPKNLEVMGQPKILVPDIADRASFAIDNTGMYAFTSGYAITMKGGVSESMGFVLGLLNSRILEFYWKQVSAPLRGGFYRYFTQFMEQLPIPSASAEQQGIIESIVSLILEQYRKSFANGGLMAVDAQIVVWLEQLVNGLVYELFFHDDLHEAGIHLFELVARVGFQSPDKSAPLSGLFQKHNDVKDSLYKAMYSLRALSVVRAIEGEV